MSYKSSFKSVLIISSTSEIGISLIRIFLESGAKVIMHTTSQEKLSTLKESFAKYKQTAVFLEPISLKSDKYESWFNSVCKKHSPDSIVICTGKLTGLSGEAETLEVNAIYPIHTCEHFVEYASMDKDRGYNILFLNSILSEIYWLKPTMYGYAKGAVTQYLMSLKNDHPNIMVHNVCLGPISTRLIYGTEFADYINVATPKDAAECIFNGLMSNKTNFYVPKIWTLNMFVLNCITALPKIITIFTILYLSYRFVQNFIT